MSSPVAVHHQIRHDMFELVGLENDQNVGDRVRPDRRIAEAVDLDPGTSRQSQRTLARRRRASFSGRSRCGRDRPGSRRIAWSSRSSGAPLLACNRMRHFSTTARASRFSRRSSDASIRHRPAGARGSAPGRSAPRCPLALARQRWANRRAGRVGQWSHGHPGGRPTDPLFFGCYICVRFLRILY